MCVCVKESKRASKIQKCMQRGMVRKKKRKGGKNDIPNYPSSFAKPAGQPSKHSVHLRLRASRTSKTFTKYPLTTHSLLFVSGVLFICLVSLSSSGDDNSGPSFYSCQEILCSDSKQLQTYLLKSFLTTCLTLEFEQRYVEISWMAFYLCKSQSQRPRSISQWH